MRLFWLQNFFKFFGYFGRKGSKQSGNSGGKYMCGAPERMSAFGARTFPTVITTSMVHEKIAGVDCMMR
jgi:hypothetical protein